MKIELIALDLDDTLLNDQQQLSRENHDAIIAAEDMGIRVVLASGRGPFAMAPYLKQLEMDSREGYAVCSNGALVMRSDTGEELAFEGLAADIAAEVMEWAESRAATLQTYRENIIYYNRSNSHSHMDSKLTGLQRVQASPEDILAMRPVKYVLPGEPEILQAYQTELKYLLGERANIIFSKPYFLEVLAPRADKGFGLAHLCDILQVQQDRVMAMGDAQNDIGMLKWAGFSVAMANATPEAKAAADAVTENDNNNAGVAEALRRFVLK